MRRGRALRRRYGRAWTRACPACERPNGTGHHPECPKNSKREYQGAEDFGQSVEVPHRRRRHGHSHGAGYVEARLGRGGLWDVSLIRDGGTSTHVFDVRLPRGAAIELGQREAKARHVPFLMT